MIKPLMLFIGTLLLSAVMNFQPIKDIQAQKEQERIAYQNMIASRQEIKLAGMETGDDMAEAVCEEPVVEEEPYFEQYTYIGEWTVTAYCPCAQCNGGYTGTASGAPLTPYWTAASNSLPFGTQLLIGDSVYCVEDTGYSPYGDNWIDILFATHDEALAWGVRTVSVYIVN